MNQNDSTNIPNRNNENKISSKSFVTKTCKQWIEEVKNAPTPEMLFDSLWFQDEICFLFADSNIGKSILSYQIGDSISSGKPMEGFRMPKIPQKVLYFDFEMSPKQLEQRISLNGNYHEFHENFLRSEMYFDIDSPDEDPTNKMVENIEIEIRNSESKIVIVDNFIHLGNNLEQSKFAIPLMRQLVRIKRKLNISLLILAHTPKRDTSQPITANDLANSRAVFNLIDSAFSIGEGKEGKLRYIKQIKVRNSTKEYGADNVIVCKIEQAYNLVEFKKVRTGYELDLINPKPLTDSEREVIEYKRKNVNASLNDILKVFPDYKYKMQISRILNKGWVEHENEKE